MVGGRVLGAAISPLLFAHAPPALIALSPFLVNLVMVADGLMTQCENGEVGCERELTADYLGCLGTALLEDTGFDASGNACDAGQDVAGGGTGWLTMSGNVLPGEIIELRLAVWDSSGHSRWFVIPERPSGTEGFTDEQLMDLVTTESMMGVALAGQS